MGLLFHLEPSFRGSCLHLDCSGGELEMLTHLKVILMSHVIVNSISVWMILQKRSLHRTEVSKRTRSKSALFICRRWRRSVNGSGLISAKVHPSSSSHPDRVVGLMLRLPSPGHVLQLLWGPQGVPESTPGLPPGGTYSEHLPMGHPDQMPEPSQLAPLEEQVLLRALCL